MNSIIGWRANEGSTDPLAMISIFQDALHQEIEELEKSHKDLKLEVKNGDLISSSSNYNVYRFLIEEDVFLEDDTPVDILIGDKRVNGNIVSIDGEGINLSIKENIGLHIPIAKIISSKSQLLKALSSRYEDVQSGALSLNMNGSMKLFGFIQPTKHNEIGQINFDYDFMPNKEQVEAINKALSQEVTFIWGPPGTGKTKTLSIILDQYIKLNKKTLVISHTNLAVDEVLKKYAENPDNHDIIDDGKVIRYGASSNPDPILEALQPDAILNKKCEKYYQQITDYENQIHELEDHIKYLESVFSSPLFIELEELESDLIKKKSLSEGLKQNIVSNENQQRSKETNQKELNDQLSSILNGGFIKRLFSESPESIKSKISAVELEIASLKTKISDQQLLLNDCLRNENKIETEIIRIKSEISLLVKPNNIDNADSLKESIKNYRDYTEGYKSEIRKLKEQIEQIRKSLFDNAIVIGCTLTKAYLDPNIFKCIFDVMILDEASMAPLPMVFFAAGLVKGQYIITGDFRQLSPIASGSSEACTIWLKRDIFEQAGIIKRVIQGEWDERLVMLREQHRMHPDIANLINGLMYDGKLVTNDTILDYTSKIAELPPYKNSILLVDTSSINPWCTTVKSSRINLYSAILSANIADLMLKNGVETIGIVTPYSPQAKLINNLLEGRKISKTSVIASTVHRFQGNEKDCIIFDLVDGNPEGIGRPLQGKLVNSDTGRLMNVAISRAKGKFVVIANKNYFNRKLDHDGVAYGILANVESHYQSIDSRKILSQYLDINSTKASPKKQITINKNDVVILTESDFYPYFKEAIKNAKIRVIVHSPFITKKRVGTLIEYFREAINRGIDVIFITRNPESQPNSPEDYTELFKSIKNEGIKIITPNKNNRLHEQLHQKYAIIDDHILYNGSLNILSQNNSGENMLMFTDPRLIRDFLEFSGMENLIQKYEWSNLNSQHMKKNKLNFDIENALLRAGIAQFENGFYDKATDLFKAAIAKNSKVSEYHYYLGITYFKVSHYDDAINEFNEAIRIDPNDNRYLIALEKIMKEKVHS